MPRKKLAIQRETICIRGNRDKWLDFIHKCKKERKQVWDVLEPWIDEFLKEN